MYFAKRRRFTAHRSYYESSPVNYYNFSDKFADRVARSKWVQKDNHPNAIRRQTRYNLTPNASDREYLGKRFQYYMGLQKARALLRLRAYKNRRAALRKLENYRFLQTMKKDSRGYYYM